MSKKAKAIAAFALAMIILVGLIVYHQLDKTPQEPKEFKTVQETTETNDAWEMTLTKTGDGYRIVNDGVPEIKSAKTQQEATKAAEKWVNAIKVNPYVLSGIGGIILKEKVTPEELYVQKGELIICSDKAKDIAERIVIKLSTMFITPASAEEVKGFNTGLSDGQIVRSENPIITGDKAALKLESIDGKDVYYLLARCGNLVIREKIIPPGPTDQAEYARFKATKSWIGVPKNVTVPAVTFDLIRNDGKVVDSKVLKPGLTVVDFGDHIVKDLNGKRYSYTVREHVPEGYTLTKKGEFSFVNTYKAPPEKKTPETTSITTKKIWVNEHLDPNAPTSVRINLLQDGKIYDSIRLDKSNNWQFTFRDLPVYDNKGHRHNYRVVEIDVPDRYEVNYEGFDIINTYIKPKKPPENGIVTPKSDNPKDYVYPEKKPGNNQVDYSQGEDRPPAPLREEERAEPAPKNEVLIIDNEEQDITEYKEEKTPEERHEKAVQEAEPLPGGEDLPPNDGEIDAPSNPNGQ